MYPPLTTPTAALRAAYIKKLLSPRKLDALTSRRRINDPSRFALGSLVSDACSTRVHVLVAHRPPFPAAIGCLAQVLL